MLPTGELRWHAIANVLELDEIEHLLYALVDLLLVELPFAQAEGDVVTHGHMWEKRLALEHHRGSAVVRRSGSHLCAVDVNLALIRLFKSGDHAERGCFPTAGGSEQGDKRAVRHVQIDAVDGPHVAIGLHQVLETNSRYRGHTNPFHTNWPAVRPSSPAKHKPPVLRVNSETRGTGLCREFPTGLKNVCLAQRWRIPEIERNTNALLNRIAIDLGSPCDILDRHTAC